jgi:hypothetical protein
MLGPIMKYWVFISCSQQDKECGEWLHEALQSYRVPQHLVGNESRDGVVPERIFPIFRDCEEVATSFDLGSSVREALRESRYLIVICSPHSAQSDWIGEEIKIFKKLGREDRILALIVNGEPNASDGIPTFRVEDECLHEAMRYQLDNGELSEIHSGPVTVDAREGKDGKDGAKLKLLAALLGLNLGDLTQRGQEAHSRFWRDSFPSKTPQPFFRSEIDKESKVQKHEDVVQQVFDEDVQFSVYRPKTMYVGNWHTWLTFAYRGASGPGEPDPKEEVERQARAVLGAEFDHGKYEEARQESATALPRESMITVVPEVVGLRFNPPQRSFVWQEPVHREEFRAIASAECVGQTLRGKITVFLGALVLAEINVRVIVSPGTAVKANEKVGPSEQTVADRASVYRKIFASYSRRDRAVVDHLEKLAAAFGDRYLRDVNDIRAGEIWSERLEEMIRDANVFQLFWSSNSMRSKYVRQEWEYALGLDRSNFIRPTYWEDPLPSDPSQSLPPKNLSNLHFQRIPIPSLPDLPDAVPIPVASSSRPRERTASPPIRSKARLSRKLVLGVPLIILILCVGVGTLQRSRGIRVTMAAPRTVEQKAEDRDANGVTGHREENLGLDPGEAEGMEPTFSTANPSPATIAQAEPPEDLERNRMLWEHHEQSRAQALERSRSAEAHGTLDATGVALFAQGKYVEAEGKLRQAVNLRDETLGAEHPDTLQSCYHLALALRAEKKMDEAKVFAKRAAKGAEKILGKGNQNRMDYEKLWRELQAEN